MTTHKLVPVEPTEEMTTAMELADDYPDTPSNHEVHSASYRGALAAAPNEGRVSREQVRLIRLGLLEPVRFVPMLPDEWLSQWQARAVIAALGLEIGE